jgi:hypothetical protein
LLRVGCCAAHATPARREEQLSGTKSRSALLTLEFISFVMCLSSDLKLWAFD